MKKVIFSKAAFRVYSGFMVNAAAAWFLSIPVATSFSQLTWRASLTIIALGLAIVLERKSK